jgi:O-6-methylguanine DNA methyltransferase
MAKLYWSRFTAAGIGLELYSSSKGLIAIRLREGSEAKLARWLARYFESAEGEREIEVAGVRHEAIERQLTEYLEGRRRVFEMDLDLRGTEFQREVWRAVAAVPYGQTASYGEIAHVIGRPRASRAVGAANGANPVPIVIPCHRILGADGSLTGYGGGLPTKRRLLALEGLMPSPAVQIRLFG